MAQDIKTSFDFDSVFCCYNGNKNMARERKA